LEASRWQREVGSYGNTSDCRTVMIVLHSSCVVTHYLLNSDCIYIYIEY
jgi:hypothetical protein